MTLQTRVRATDTAMPATTSLRPVLTPTQWNMLHDMLTLALDALGERPEDFDRAFLQNAVLHQRLALRLTHKAMTKEGLMQ